MADNDAVLHTPFESINTHHSQKKTQHAQDIVSYGFQTFFHKT